MSMIVGDPSIRLSAQGYTDCVGRQPENLALRQRRMRRVLDALPPEARAKVLFAFTWTTTDYLASNNTAEGRAQNRAVRITLRSLPPTGRQACDVPTRAGNLDEYLFLVRCLESRLNLGSRSDAPQALSVLRQIYYFGTARWSRSQSPIWGAVITHRAWPPGTDPTPQLGQHLMDALRAGQVVEGVDIGHILTGLDAMMQPHHVTLRFLQASLANEEWATWAGDVGSAATHYAMDELYGTRRGNYNQYFTRYASDAYLYGDIDSFAIRAGLSPQRTPPSLLMQQLQLNAPLSSALGQARSARVRAFISAYGGRVVNRRLTNRSTLVNALRPSCETFAGLLAIQELGRRGNMPPRPAGAPSSTVLMDSSVTAMTNRFVDWLTSPSRL